MAKEVPKIHLYHHPHKTQKRGVVNTYSLATCYRDEEGRNKKNVLLRLGELSFYQVEQYKALLKVMNRLGKGAFDSSLLLADLSEVCVKSERNFLGVYLLSALWDKLGIEAALGGEKDPRETLSSAEIAKILTLNRLLAPSSKTASIDWFRTTYLPEIMGISPSSYNRNKIFRALKKIHEKKESLERFCFDFSGKQQIEGIRIYYFDGSTSWFEGVKADLSARDKEKTRGIYDHVLSLMLITDAQGYPVAWDAVDGNRKDVSELENFVKRVSDRYGVKDITYCFDRGVSSQHNYSLIAERGSKYISGIRDDQIKEVFDLDAFNLRRDELIEWSKDLKKKTSISKRRIAGVDGFYAFGKRTFYKDLGVINERRYIVSFNAQIHEKERETRDKNIIRTLKAVSTKNADLQTAKRARDFNATERDLLELLRKNKTTKIFDYKLMPVISSRNVNSFQIELSLNQEKLQKQKQTDGLLVYVTNHTEKNGKRFKLHASEVIAHYRSKYVIENAFRELKSFIDLRPFHVRLDDHVKAHYDICVLAYFINTFIYRTLKNQDIGIRPFYKKLREFSNKIELQTTDGKSVHAEKHIDEQMQRYINALGLQNTHRFEHTSPETIQ